MANSPLIGNLSARRPAPIPTPPRMTTATNAPQAKKKGPDKWGTVIYRCSRCEIDYRTQEDRKPVCPLCEERSKSQVLRDEIKKLAGANELLQRDLKKHKSQLTILDGMREAVTELDDGDAMFLKELIYRYREAPGSVRVSQATRKRKVEHEYGTVYRHEVSGWTVDYRDTSPPEQITHAASSVGGAMIALQFSEALKVIGLKGAMEMLTKAMSKTMANAHD